MFLHDFKTVKVILELQILIIFIYLFLRRERIEQLMKLIIKEKLESFHIKNEESDVNCNIPLKNSNN